MKALVEFSRPHTIIGTTLAVFAMYALATAAAGHQDLGLVGTALLCSLAVNVYIVGLNQLTDVEIDRINKPYLPLAAGTMSQTAALVLVSATGVVSLAISAMQGWILFATIGTIFLIGTAYSLPPLRLKRFPFFAAASITVARALVLNVGLYLAYSAALTGRPSLPAHVILFAGFMFVFVIVIALMKDIPDIDGDRRNQISTLVIRLGAAKTLLLCKVLLTVDYLTVVGMGLAGVRGVHIGTLVATHGAALATVWIASARVNRDDSKAVYRYYMIIWKLFYFEVVAFCAACLLARVA